jgi:rhodanese-related sulfurtransferase
MKKLHGASIMIFRIIGLFMLSVVPGHAAPPYKNADNQQLQALLAQGVPMYDVRRADEWRQTGVIAGSRRLTFVDGGGKLNPEFMPQFTQAVGKNDPVILICRTGNRTDVLARYLVEKFGYTQVYNVREGIMGWMREGRPVQRD